MAPQSSFLFYLILLLIINLMEANQDLNTNKELGKTTAELVKLRGYQAEDHYVITSDGYILNVVRAWNQLIYDAQGGLLNKDPILFIHGDCFLFNSVGASPKDYSNLDAGSMSIEELEQLLQNDPTTNSLVFTALNFGHECWIFNRRGTYQSQGHVEPSNQPFINHNETTIASIANATQADPYANQSGANLSTFLTTPELDLDHLELLVNPKYWNFSLDEQVEKDLPQVMDYCLEQANRSKLAIVAHSTGGAITLMTLINEPERANKVSHALLWAPAIYPTGYRAVELSSALEPITMSFIGPAIPSVLKPLLHDAVDLNCHSNTTEDSICMNDFIYGLSGNQELLHEMFNFHFDSFSSHSIAQLAQAASSGKMHHYDYVNGQTNRIAYGQAEAPVYNVSDIRPTKMSFWFGGTDALVSVFSGHEIVKDLTFQVEAHYLDQPDLSFNHVSYFNHKDVAKLVIIPGLKFLESM